MVYPTGFQNPKSIVGSLPPEVNGEGVVPLGLALLSVAAVPLPVAVAV
jgi:hypothetical protein